MEGWHHLSCAYLLFWREKVFVSVLQYLLLVLLVFASFFLPLAIFPVEPFTPGEGQGREIKRLFVLFCYVMRGKYVAAQTHLQGRGGKFHRKEIEL
jgi:hypothetical protein